MFSDKNKKFNSLFLPLVAMSSHALADYKTDVGYTQLQAELGAAIPNGSNVKVAQVEASTVKDTEANYPIFAPDPTPPAMSGKSFTYPGLTCGTPPCTPSVFSPHAFGVAATFYGNNVSMASGINDIDSYEANQWLNSLYYQIGPNAGKATASDNRVANHSWASFGTYLSDSSIAKLIDRQVAMNEYIQIAATDSQVMGNTFNAINVGLTSATTGSHSSTVYVNKAIDDTVDNTYVSGRSMTDLVAPAINTSTATPIVSSATALLVQTGHQNTNLSNGSGNTSGVGTIYNAERSETIKAILMAGADRETDNTSGNGNIADYRNVNFQTANGLDSRYGAGQLNIYNSYQIMAAGEQNSLEDNGNSIGMLGFDYDDSFGGSTIKGKQSNSTATYTFTTLASESIAASLVWNVGISNTGTMTPTVHHLGLTLFDVTDNQTVAESISEIDNTQNIYWTNLVAGHEYELLISSLEGANNLFTWDYALAWNRSINPTTVPIPAAFWLFGSALVSLLGVRRKSGNAEL